MDRAAEIAALGEAARATFDAHHGAREITIASARRAIQACAASIRATHRGEYEDAERLADEARAHVHDANTAISQGGQLALSGPLPDAKKELAEAWITLALVRDEPLSEPDALGVEWAAYLKGMAEAASELRRQVLDRLREGDTMRAETLVGAMDDVYSVLVTIDYPDAVTSGLRRSTDALRAVLERTRADLTTTIVASRLQHTIESAQRAVDDA